LVPGEWLANHGDVPVCAKGLKSWLLKELKSHRQAVEQRLTLFVRPLRGASLIVREEEQLFALG